MLIAKKEPKTADPATAFVTIETMNTAMLRRARMMSITAMIMDPT
jgi:hypothetical protein